MIKITHLGVYQIHQDKLFDKVNSYTDLVKAIKKWAKKNPLSEDDEEYNNKTGKAYEIFAQFWALTFGHNNAINIKDLIDTSDDKYHRGNDFSYKDLFENPGMIQVKFRNSGNYQFYNGALDSFIQKARRLDPTNTVLFISIDNHKDLFHYEYEEIRKDIRIIDRKTQEYYINTEPNFWDNFRKCIEESAKIKFEDKFKLRDVQEWIRFVNKERGFIGTQSVINRIETKGKVEASTATGKSLCIQEDTESALDSGRKIVLVTIPWRSLISQTFADYYIHKSFGWQDENNVIHNSDKPDCIIMMSGENVRYNENIVDVFKSLKTEYVKGRILTNLANNKKTIIFTTLESYDKWYDEKTGCGVFTDLMQSGQFNKDDVFEIFDEYHNIIPSTGERKEHLITAKFLETLHERNSGAIFYSASNKHGQYVSSYYDNQFGKLLAKVTRQDLYERGFVCPGLEFRVIKLKNIWASAEDRRRIENEGVDLNKAQIEAAGIVTAYEDLKNYYTEPNLMTFGSHVPGCNFITQDKGIQNRLKDVKLHFMSADTPNSERSRIIDIIKKSGNNILNQHSVAKEGVNIPNLHAGLIHRNMEFREAQQAIGRSDRALYEDTLNFQAGKISLDSPIGWKKYWNIIYLIVSDEDDLIFQNMMVDIIRYLKSNGIPKDKWAFSVVDDIERNGVKKSQKSEYNKKYSINFDIDKLNTIIKNAEIKAESEIQDEITSMDNIVYLDYEKEIEKEIEKEWFESLSNDEYNEYIKNIAETIEKNANNRT